VGNPIWRAFVAEQMESWIDFFRNNHVESYIDLVEKFIRLHPYYIPDFNDIRSDESNILYRLLWNSGFNDKLSDKGLLVWASSPFSEFIEELAVYQYEYKEINFLVGMFSRHSLWFERVYSYIRKGIKESRGL